MKSFITSGPDLTGGCQGRSESPLYSNPKSLDLLHSHSVLVCVVALRLSQLFFSYVIFSCLPGLNQY